MKILDDGHPKEDYRRLMLMLQDAKRYIASIDTAAILMEEYTKADWLLAIEHDLSILILELIKFKEDDK